MAITENDITDADLTRALAQLMGHLRIDKSALVFHARLRLRSPQGRISLAVTDAVPPREQIALLDSSIETSLATAVALCAERQALLELHNAHG